MLAGARTCSRDPRAGGPSQEPVTTRPERRPGHQRGARPSTRRRDSQEGELILRKRALVGAAAVLAAAGCAGETDTSAPSSAPNTAEATAPAAAQPGGTRLRAVVGTPEDPDAYEITLTDASGEAVERLPAGSYTIAVADLSRIHNFHLIGPGVDEATSVRGVEDATFQVTLRPGDYRFVCDPHPNMRGNVTVI